jgi:hypothetical protein
VRPGSQPTDLRVFAQYADDLTPPGCAAHQVNHCIGARSRRQCKFERRPVVQHVMHEALIAECSGRKNKTPEAVASEGLWIAQDWVPPPSPMRSNNSLVQALACSSSSSSFAKTRSISTPISPS